MPQPPQIAIREALIAEICEREPKTQFDATLQQRSVLEGVARKLGVLHNQALEQALLTEWGDLFRTGLLAWGLNLSNPDPPHFHLTDRGREALKNWTRDPSNPAGYLRHLDAIAKLDSVASSYLREGLECYVAGFHKAAAVMVGGAAEKVILDLRDATAAKLISLGRVPLPKGIEAEEWRIKSVSDALRKFFDDHKGKKAGQLGGELSEALDGYWSPFTLQIRAARNDAGHPTSVDPVTSDTVHASLLIFPELARLAEKLAQWVRSELR
jgi:hypothetical protein